MQREEINEKIISILDVITESPSIFYRSKSPKQVSDPSKEFCNEHVELLLQLETRIYTSDSKDYFWKLLGYNFIVPIPLREISPIGKVHKLISEHCDCAFMTYVKAGRTSEALEGFSMRLKTYSSIGNISNRIIYCLFQILANEPHLFSNEYVKTIESIINKYQNCINEAISWGEKKELTKAAINSENPDAIPIFLPQFFPSVRREDIPIVLPSPELIKKSNDLLLSLNKVLKIVKFERVKQEFRGVSSAINQDKTQLVRRYKDLKLNQELVEALEKIDVEIEETGSKFNFSKSIGFVRNIYEESLRQFAERIRDTTGKSIPQWSERGKMGEAVSYFRTIKLISESEEKMLIGFSSLVSETGSHSLTSERYEVRIAKNILVEICSYLVDKIDNHLNTFIESKS